PAEGRVAKLPGAAWSAHLGRTRRHRARRQPERGALPRARGRAQGRRRYPLSPGRSVRRADRLFEIIQRLRRGRVVTASTLAQQLEVSERTVYRDIRDLMARRVPIEGAAGVGYSLRRGYDLPPLMFDESELEALVFGARI